jgi:hypothetical protein
LGDQEKIHTVRDLFGSYHIHKDDKLLSITEVAIKGNPDGKYATR